MQERTNTMQERMNSLQERINVAKTDPDAYKAMMALEAYLVKTSLTAKQKDLIKIRASQLNGCSYCIDLHTKEARKAGESEQRIYALSAWRETPYFSEEERVLLALTEEVTLIQGRVSDITYQEAKEKLAEKRLSEAMMAAIVINAWNRIGIATNMKPPLG
ncbi:MAG: carboxymuconolactone decarboxylase family protein [Puia sp.]|nr:carboxymuconolactone decarboxylase family protein [Puia sp.]